MRYGVISDIHANVTALEAVFRDAAECGVERFICLGDVVGYGPQPQEALRLVRERVAVTIAGNHDDAVSGRLGAEDFIDLAADAVARHREALDAGSLAWLGSLPYTCEFGGAAAAHGDFTEPRRFYYVTEDDDAIANFGAVAHQLMFVGHSHVPSVYLTGRSGAVYRIEPQDFVVEEGKRYIVNPGSVGYPRQSHGECFSTYVVYDSDTREVFFRSLPFAVSGMLQRGVNPRRMKLKVLSLIVGAAALIAAAAAYLLAPKTEVAEDPALVCRTESIALSASAEKVSPNLKLAADSCPVELRIVFKNAGGKVLVSDTKTVKQSDRRKYSVPDGAASAEFTLRRQSRSVEPKVESFAPSVVSGK